MTTQDVITAARKVVEAWDKARDATDYQDFDFAGFDEHITALSAALDAAPGVPETVPVLFVSERYGHYCWLDGKLYGHNHELGWLESPTGKGWDTLEDYEEYWSTRERRATPAEAAAFFAQHGAPQAGGGAG